MYGSHFLFTHHFCGGQRSSFVLWRQVVERGHSFLKSLNMKYCCIIFNLFPELFQILCVPSFGVYMEQLILWSLRYRVVIFTFASAYTCPLKSHRLEMPYRFSQVVVVLCDSHHYIFASSFCLFPDPHILYADIHWALRWPHRIIMTVHVFYDSFFFLCSPSTEGAIVCTTPRSLNMLITSKTPSPRKPPTSSVSTVLMCLFVGFC